MADIYDDTSSSSSDDEDEDDDDLGCLRPNNSSSSLATAKNTHLLSRSIVHLDVDAFYCQCEELSNPDLATKPFAIGQKHIIVTCNYIARSRGVSKLMLRTAAMKACPELIIIEGSDLEPYRRQARKIYNAFRTAVAALPGGTDNNLAKKGGMDEMYADISAAVNSFLSSSKHATSNNDDMFVYGDDSSTRVSIAEDQSGATADVNNAASSFSYLSRDPDARKCWGNSVERDECRNRLHDVAAKFAAIIRLAVKKETGFRACAGVSTSPMLSKLASELRKPDSLNVLYPWRASSIIDVMPLRKIPGLGSRTLKSLEKCLREHNSRSSDKDSPYWTCSDLLRVPHQKVVASCGEQQSNILLQRCRGIDPLLIVDDNGGLGKTVSVEDSYRQGTVTALDEVLRLLEELYCRLPRLLDNRKSDSDRPELAFPSTIRFSARIVGDSTGNSKRRPFVTKSKQSSFDGRKLMMSGEEDKRSEVLRRAVRPLLDEILRHDTKFVVTRLNIAVTGFADLGLQASGSGSQQKAVTQFFSAGQGKMKSSPQEKSISAITQSSHSAYMKRKAPTLDDMFSKRSSKRVAEGAKECSTSKCTTTSTSSAILPEKLVSNEIIDPSFLAALPPDIRAEVAASHAIQSSERGKGNTNEKSGRIDNYFRK